MDRIEVQERFHKGARQSFRAAAKGLGLEAGTYDIHTNRSGIASLGETTLHGERIFIQAGGLFGEPYLLLRTCDGRKDVHGHGNNYLSPDSLNTPEHIVAEAKRLIAVQFPNF